MKKSGLFLTIVFLWIQSCKSSASKEDAQTGNTYSIDSTDYVSETEFIDKNKVDKTEEKKVDKQREIEFHVMQEK